MCPIEAVCYAVTGQVHGWAMAADYLGLGDGTVRKLIAASDDSVGYEALRAQIEQACGL